MNGLIHVSHACRSNGNANGLQKQPSLDSRQVAREEGALQQADSMLSNAPTPALGTGRLQAADSHKWDISHTALVGQQGPNICRICHCNSMCCRNSGKPMILAP